MLLIGGAGVAQNATPVPAAAIATPPTICDVLQRPADFDGKTVRLSGTVQAGLTDFVLRSQGCGRGPAGVPQDIWIDLPEGSRAKAGPALRVTLAAAGQPAKPIPAVRLDHSAAFRSFDDALSAPLHPAGVCLGCMRNTVTATLTGVLQSVPVAGVHKNGKRVQSVSGFGHLNAYRVRLLLEEVEDVVPKPIDMSPAEPFLQQSRPDVVRGGDPAAVLKQLAEAFQNGTVAFGQIRRAGVAFGTPADHDGVTLRAEVPNEARVAEEQGAGTSSDGLLATVSYDPARLSGEPLLLATAQAGCELADLREGTTTPDFFELERHALQTVILVGATLRERSITLPGGNTVWSADWPETSRPEQMGVGMLRYMREWIQAR